MKKTLIILIVFLMSGTWSFGQNGIDTKSVLIRNLSGSGLKTIAVDNGGNIINDSTRLAKGDSSLTYYTPYYINSNFATLTDLAAIDVGLIIKDSVSVATTANMDLNGAETIDGISSFVGMRVLVHKQTDSIQNGIYVVASGAWTRSTDLDTWAKLYRAYCAVSRGTTQGGASYVCGIGSTGTINVNKVWFNIFAAPSSITAGAGLDKTGNQIYVLVDNATVETSSDILRIKDAGVVNAKVATGIDAVKIGNGTISNTEFQQLNGIRSDSTIQHQIDSKSIKSRWTGFVDSVANYMKDFQGHGTAQMKFYSNGTLIQTLTLPPATTITNGLMSIDDKNKLNSIESGAEVNVKANWNETNTAADAYIQNKPTSLSNTALLEDSSKFDISGTSVNKNITAKPGIYQLTIDAANDTNQIKIGSSTSPTDFYLRNYSGFCDILNSNRSGLRIYSSDGSVGVIKNGSLLYGLPTEGGAYGYSLTSNGAANVCSWTNVSGGGGGGSGTVTSVGLSLPTELTVSNSPVTTAGTLTAAWANATANTVFMGQEGVTGTPNFGTLTDSHVPNDLTIASTKAASFSGATFSTSGLLTLPANTNTARLRITPGTSNPTTLVNGDIWVTSAGAFARVNGATISLGGGTSSGVLTFTSSTATGIYEAGTAQNPYPKISVNNLTSGTSVLGLTDKFMFSNTESATTPKEIYSATGTELKALFGTTFALTVKDIDNTPIVSNVSTIVFDGATVVDSATGIVKVIITPSSGGGDEGFRSLNGITEWSWLTPKNAQDTLDASKSITFSSQSAGQAVELWIYPHASNDYVLTLPAACFFANDHDNTFNIEHGTGIVYVFTFKYNGTITRCDYATYNN
jgi:hypothetical protein